jgi:hypothetical protein
VKWPWNTRKPDPDELRSTEVNKALDSSARRLKEAQRAHQEIKPELDRARRYAERNHFGDAVAQIFRVVN